MVYGQQGFTCHLVTAGDAELVSIVKQPILKYISEILVGVSNNEAEEAVVDV
jgi:hypothetical protein